MNDTDVGLMILVAVSWVWIAATFWFADMKARKKMLDKDK